MDIVSKKTQQFVQKVRPKHVNGASTTSQATINDAATTTTTTSNNIYANCEINNDENAIDNDLIEIEINTSAQQQLNEQRSNRSNYSNVNLYGNLSRLNGN